VLGIQEVDPKDDDSNMDETDSNFNSYKQNDDFSNPYYDSS